MHIYVTGAAGKLGSALLKRLLEINFALELEVDARDGGTLAASKATTGGADTGLAASDLQWLTGTGEDARKAFVTEASSSSSPFSTSLRHEHPAEGSRIYTTLRDSHRRRYRPTLR